MIRFTIYTYLFKPINEPYQPELFSPNVNVDESMEKKKEIFGNFFKNDSLMKFHRGSQCFDHLVVSKRTGIIVMQIANNTKQTHEKEFYRWTEEDHPSLYVIIDNREEGKQVIAIENRQQAFSETKTVASIMEESFNKLLQPFRLQVQINAKYHTHEFWDVVSQYKQGIASVTFKFPYPNMPEISDMVGDFYTDLARRTNSEPKTTLTSPSQEKMILEKGDKIIEQMIRAASASGKLIMMRPKGAKKWRRIGMETPVQEELSEQVLKGLNEVEIIPRKWQAVEDFLNRILIVYY